MSFGETAALALNPQQTGYYKQRSLRPTRSGLTEWISRVQHVVD